MSQIEGNKHINGSRDLTQFLQQFRFGCYVFLPTLTLEKIIQYSALLRQTILSDYEISLWKCQEMKILSNLNIWCQNRVPLIVA